MFHYFFIYVFGNVAVIIPEFIAFVAAGLAPVTVKPLAGIPVKVYPDFGVSVIVAV